VRAARRAARFTRGNALLLRTLCAMKAITMLPCAMRAARAIDENIIHARAPRLMMSMRDV